VPFFPSAPVSMGIAAFFRAKPQTIGLTRGQRSTRSSCTLIERSASSMTAARLTRSSYIARRGA
jgi:hypothetical protein